MLKQRARITWALKGDRNSKFYHQCVQRRRCSNLIRRIYWNNTWASSPVSLKEAFHNYFSGQFNGDKSPIIFKLGSLQLNKLDEGVAENLERVITETEVEHVLKLMAPDKAPGPDGFNMGCIKIMWKIL